MATLREILESHLPALEAAGLYNPLADARALLCRALGLEKSTFDSVLLRPVSSQDAARIESYFRQRAARIPLDRIFGTAPFYGLSLQTDAEVFKPYPETEAMVEHALLATASRQTPLRFLDVGTGNGAILLALLSQLPEATGLGVDNSDAALALAAKNAKAIGFSDRAVFCRGNWCDGIKERFDLILSNPPRVATRDIPRLLPEMREHDPRSALDGGKDGLRYYRWLAKSAPHLAQPEALLFMQVGTYYAEAVAKIFRAARLTDVIILKNYLGLPCCVMAKISPRASDQSLWKKWLSRS